MNVLVSVPHGGAAGNILRTGVIARVLETDPAVRVVMVSPLVKDPNFAREFSHPRISLEDLPPHRPAGLEARLLALVQAAYLDSGVTESVKIRRAEALEKGTVRWVKAKKLLASILAPSMVRPATRYDLSDRLVSHPWADELFDRYKPAMLVVSNPGLIFSEVPLLRTAARRGVRSVAVDPSWDNFTNKLIPVRRVNRLIVWNELMKEQAVSLHGYQPAEIRLAGTPQWDPYFKSGVLLPRDVFMRQIGADPSRKLVTLTTTPLELYAHYDRVIRALVDAMNGGRWPEPSQILVRVHPRDDRKRYTAFEGLPGVIVEKPFKETVRAGDGMAVDVTAETQRHLANTMAHSDVVVQVASTIAIEASIFDTPVVNVSFDGETPSPFVKSARRYLEFTHFANIIKRGAVRDASTPEEMVELVGRYLAEPALDREGRRQVVLDQCQFLDGRAAERVAELRHRIPFGSHRPQAVISSMCGIAGFVSLSGKPADGERLAAMVRTLHHRGPDDHGHFTEGPAALGAARLSIIDVAGGHQPISIDGGAVTVAQNGEIYNYVELREGLHRLGRHTATAGDTEVIAHLYATEGIAGFRKMRGMFAVAIWDAPRQRLVLARDRVGKKPLYYYEHKGELLFGSETKSILAALDQVPAVNPEALLSFFTFGYVAGPDAIFRGMHRLEPGTALIVDTRSGEVRHEPYWQWPDGSIEDVRTEDEVIDALRAELDTAVRIRLRSDVPLGAFLSGGMDSAAVLALMARHSSRPVQTFTIGFGDPAYDELDEARSTAAAFGADHHEQIVTPDAVKVAEALAFNYDEPFADASAIPTYYVAELARKHVTVCLSGDGGDELFAGYTPYADALKLVGGPGVGLMRAAIAAGARLVPVHARGKGRLSTMGLGPESWFVWRRTVFPDYLLEAVVAPDVIAAGRLPEREAVAQIRSATGTLLSRLQHWDQRHYLVDDILVKVDRATMAHSLEARCPLLDHHVIELAGVQASSRHGDALVTKRLFRKVIEPWVPDAVLTRPKRGFGVPLRRWFQEGMVQWAREILVDPRTQQRGWTRSTEVNALLEQHEQGRRDHAKRIWALVCLELWARRHVDRAQTDVRACA